MNRDRPQYSADWGDYISFAHHMRKKADDNDVDLLLVDTGDRIEGNGLYDASTPKGLFQYDIYAEQDVDIICTGNHELYQAYSITREHNTTVPNFKKNYIASNLDYIDPETGEREPQAQRYRRFTTKNGGLDIIALGFIFDFTGNANNSVVQRVEDTIKENWFQEVIRAKPDVFVVIGHIGLRMTEFKTIFTAMRKEDWDTPILFFGGHAHVRDALSYDSKSFAMASGRYMETIGWMSVDNLSKKKKDSTEELPVEEPSTAASLKFTRRYIDNNLFGMHHHTDLNESTFPTEHGKKVSAMIDRARTALQLDSKFGCAPRNLHMSRAKYPGNESIYSWIEDEVFPDIITRKDREDKSRIALMNSGGIRFDIFAGPFTRDSTYIVSPFVSKFRYIPDVPYPIAKRVIEFLNNGPKIMSETAGGLDTRFLGIPEQRFGSPHTEFTDASTDADAEEPRLELRDVQEPLREASAAGDGPELIGGYTTKDDIGKDGDDTVHQPLDFYGIPNCFQSKINFPDKGDPEKVDVVFIDFLQPWIIPALKLSGGDYGDGDVEVYMDGTFTYKMSEWISRHWDGDC